ncbi:MAG TPA: hypothetical protein VK506_11670 [Conexibacter sp.]|nr:hypothetical protein [Conexibacter sp.]
MMTRVHVDDYDAWKAMFDEDPPGVRAAATGHRLFRTAGDPGEVSIAVEFESVADAEAAREKLVSSGVLDRVQLRVPPTIVELAEAKAYA